MALNFPQIALSCNELWGWGGGGVSRQGGWCKICLHPHPLQMPRPWDRIPGDSILPGPGPRSREMKPCHHPLSDSEFCINWLIKCWADFLSRPPPPGTRQSRISEDNDFGDARSQKQPELLLGEGPPRLALSTGQAGGCAGHRAAFCPGRISAQMAGVGDPWDFRARRLL